MLVVHKSYAVRTCTRCRHACSRLGARKFDTNKTVRVGKNRKGPTRFFRISNRPERNNITLSGFPQRTRTWSSRNFSFVGQVVSDGAVFFLNFYSFVD